MAVTAEGSTDLEVLEPVAVIAVLVKLFARLPQAVVERCPQRPQGQAGQLWLPRSMFGSGTFSPGGRPP